MKNKIIKYFIFILAFNILSITCSEIVYAKTMNRSEMQEYVAATAISYYNLTKYTDYERYSMDRKNMSFSWVNYRVSPESINRSNFVTTACAAFTSMVYYYSLNYNFSDYYADSPNKNCNVSQDIYDDKYYINGLGPATGFYSNIAKDDVNNNNKNGMGVYHNENILNNYGSDKQKERCQIYMDMIGDKNTNYYKDNCKKYKLDESNTNSRLQKGDIFILRRDGTKKPSGHALLYVDDYNGQKGFLHSTGYDFEPFEDPIKLHLDDQSIYFINLNDFINKYFFSEKKTIRMKSYSILRPINRFCNNDTCYYETGKFNSTTGIKCTKGKRCTANVNSNIFAREELKNISVEQYVTNASNKVITNNYSSTNDDTSLVYRLELIGKTGSASGIKVSASIPNGAKTVECVGKYADDCEIENGTITWPSINITKDQKINIGFKVRNFEESSVTFNGFKVVINKKTLIMNKIVTPVKVTMNYTKATVIKDYFNNLNCGSNNYLTCLFKVYNEKYKTNISNITITEVRDAIFKKNSSNSEYYHRRSESESSNLSSNKKQIEAMLVPGLYGGQKVSGDTRVDRVRYLSANQLEVGDIVISYANGKGEAFIYLGEQKSCTSFKSGCSIIGKELNSKIAIYDKTTSPTARRLFRESYAKDWFVILRPSRIIEKVTVKHMKEKLDGSYTTITEKFYIGDNSSFTVEVKTYNGYTSPSAKTINVSSSNNIIEYKYKLKSYSITVDADDNVSSVTGSGKYKYGTKVTVSATPKEGYSITDWITDDNNNWNCHKDSCTITVNKKASYTAIASPKKYKITLNSDNKKIKSFYVYYNSDMGTVEIPKKTGYTFKGYYDNQSVMYYDSTGKSTKKWNKAANGDLYAKWESNKYVVEYKANGGSGTVNKSNHIYDENKNLNENKFTRTGYYFLGWNTDSSATNAIYGDKAKVKNLTSTNNGKVVLYAIWAPENNTKYTVKYWKDYISGDKNYIWATHYYYGTTDTQVTPIPETIYGYTTPAKKTVTIKGDGSTVVNYYYKRKTYTLDLTKGTGITDVSGAGSYKYYEEHELKATIKTGYTFVNWIDEKDKEISNQEVFIERRRYKNDVYKANARPNTYVVRYNCNGCTSGDMRDDTFTYDKKAPLKANSFKRDNHIFLGWSKNNSSTTASYKDKQSVVNLSSEDGGLVELYAVWKELEEIIEEPIDIEEPIVIDDPPTPKEPQDVDSNEIEKTKETVKEDEEETKTSTSTDSKTESKDTKIDTGNDDIDITWEEDEEDIISDVVDEPRNNNKKDNHNYLLLLPLTVVGIGLLLTSFWYIFFKGKKH